MSRILVFLLIAVAGWAETADEQVFREFLGWYRTYTGAFAPPDVAKAYQAKLQGDGLEAAEASRRIEVIKKTVSSMPPEFAGLYFDHIYNAPNPPFKAVASQYMVRWVEGRKPGKALDVAMGQGRNSLYLATQGWDVTGYDISEGGMAQAQKAAEKSNLKLRTVFASHEKFDYGKEQWDLIVETFAFTTLSDESYRKRVIDSLKPGGLLIIEGFGDPGRHEPKNELLERFKELRVISYEDREEVADWGLQKMRLVRIAAEKI
jgi:SAM-dependent methyltransferase